MNHNDYKEMIPAHALSALDASDDRVLTDHLAGCHECRRELDDWLATTAGLAFEAAPLEPSSRVRTRILTQVRELKIETSTAKVVPFVQPKKNVWSSFGSIGAIAAAILFVALLVNVVLLWKQNQAMERQNQALAQEIERLKRETEQSVPVRMIELNATPMAPGANATIAYDKTGHAMLMAHGLPKAPEGKEYQLWYIVGNEKMPGKTFAPDATGGGVLVDQVPSSAMNSAVFALTLEPKGGVTAPTGQIYLVSRS